MLIVNQIIMKIFLFYYMSSLLFILWNNLRHVLKYIHATYVMNIKPADKFHFVEGRAKIGNKMLKKFSTYCLR